MLASTKRQLHKEREEKQAVLDTHLATLLDNAAREVQEIRLLQEKLEMSRKEIVTLLENSKTDARKIKDLKWQVDFYKTEFEQAISLLEKSRCLNSQLEPEFENEYIFKNPDYQPVQTEYRTEIENLRATGKVKFMSQVFNKPQGPVVKKPVKGKGS